MDANNLASAISDRDLVNVTSIVEFRPRTLYFPIVQKFNPLQYAAKLGYDEIVAFLLTKYHDPVLAIYQCNTDNHNSLELAIDNEHWSIVTLLGSKLKEYNQHFRYNDSGNTILHTAARHGKIKLMEIWLDFVDDVDIFNGNGSTPLNLAIFYGFTNIVRLLLPRSKKLTEMGLTGVTLMHDATVQNNSTIVTILYEEIHSRYGEEEAKKIMNIPCYRGITPMTNAIVYGNNKIIQTVYRYGGNLNLGGPDDSLYCFADGVWNESRRRRIDGLKYSDVPMVTLIRFGCQDYEYINDLGSNLLALLIIRDVKKSVYNIIKALRDQRIVKLPPSIERMSEDSSHRMKYCQVLTSWEVYRIRCEVHFNYSLFERCLLCLC